MTRQTEEVPVPAARRSMWNLLSAVLLTATVSCGGGGDGAPGGAGGRAGGPPMAMPVGIAELKAAPVDDSSEFVGMLKSRRSTPFSRRPRASHANPRQVRRPGVGRHAAVRDRRHAAAGGRRRTRVRARRPRGRRGVRAQQAERAKKLLDAGAIEPAGIRAGDDAAEDRRGAAEGASTSRSGSSRRSWRTTASRAPTAGVVGDIPVRVGDRVDAGDGADDGRRQHRPRGLHQRAGRSRRPSCDVGLPCASSTRPAR